MAHIDHDWKNIHANENGYETILILMELGMPHEIASNIVRRAYWLQSDIICRLYCLPIYYGCCHVIGYEDVFHNESSLPEHVINWTPGSPSHSVMRKAKIKLTDLPDEVLNKILNCYLDEITFRDWANRPVVNRREWDLFCEACELLLPFKYAE